MPPIHRLPRQLTRQFLTRRTLHTTPKLHLPTNFTMPSLSPTMTSGKITSWHLPPGAPFSAGDILLSIETDKAHMDVEAPDDGVLAHIIVPAGGGVVPVGTRIAVLAEPGEDLSSLDVTVEDVPAGKSAGDSPVPPDDRQLEKREAAHQPSPSVSHLLRSHDLHPSEIVPTGPKGRLLKGDVLAHLGRIDKAWPRELGGRIGKLGKLDLSGVKAAAAPPAAAPKGEKEEKKVVAGKVDEGEEKKVEVEVSFDELVKVQGKLQETLGLHIPLSTLIAKAATKANNIPSSPPTPTAHSVFDELIAQPPAPRIIFQPRISPVLPVQTPQAQPDIIDILTDAIPARTPAVPRPLSSRPPTGGKSLLTITIKNPHEAAAGQLFLQRVKGIVEKEPGQLFL